MEIVGMECEYMAAPIGVDVARPRFGWRYEAVSNAGFMQKAFKIDIASDRQTLLDGEGGDVWSSDTIASKIARIEYDGSVRLQAHSTYYWRVTAWGEDGRRIVSEVGRFETAKFSGEDWTGKWITDRHDKTYGPAPVLRKTFEVSKEVVRARAYVSATAYYHLRINGVDILPNSLDPGYTHYDKRNLYTVTDVTELLRPGENVLGAVVGNGFYNEEAPVATWDFEKARWRDRAKFILELHLGYADGTEDRVVTDGTWKTSMGGSVYNNMYSGETYDARLEKEGWDSAGYDDTGWEQAWVTEAPSPLLVAQQTEAVKVTDEIEAVAMRAFGDSLYVFDFGVNLSGVCRIKLNGESGTKVTLRHGELLRDDGRVEMRNIDIYYKPMPGVEFQTDTYYLKGAGEEVFTPKFTYHGFRYVEVRSDKPLALKQEDVTALFIHSALEPTGSFECSNELLNAIRRATLQSYLSNLHSIPTDCPQREKNGWTADAHVIIDVALQNFDGIKFYEKWMNDFIDNQRPEGNISGIIPSSGWGYDDWIGPVWDAALFVIPDALEKYYGDTRTIHRLYDTCERYLRYLENREDADGTVSYGIGDWVPYKTQTPTDYTTRCFYYLDHRIMAHFAEVTGHDPAPYLRKAEALRAFINRTYFNAPEAIYANGSQTALAVALALGIVPEEHRQRVADKLNSMVVANDYFLDFGVLGSKYVPRALTEYGYAETVYKMATKEEAPSWGHWIKQGLTTLGETWVLSPEFRDASVNHVFLGDITSWMTRSIAGIQYGEAAPGFEEIVIKPHFVGDLTWAKAQYESVKGTISSHWTRRGERIELTVVVPENASATVYTDRMVTVKGGTHRFSFTLNR